MQETIQKCLIVGSGPAGYTAAIYAARANLHPLMYTGMEPGGQLMQTTDVENFPGYPTGIMGPAMMEEFKQQAERVGTEVRFGMATAVEFSEEGPHRVVIDGQHTELAHTVIIATGATAKWLGLPGEKRLNGHGVSACAVCDGFFYRGMDVAVVGGGDTAAEESLYLSKLCKHVHVLVRRDQMRASKIMQERVLGAANITVHWNTETLDVVGEEVVEGVLIRDALSGKESQLAVQGFFVAIGHKPNTDLFVDKLDMDAQGYLITQPGSTRTRVAGVFAAGDVQDKIYRQAVTAAGTGCMAALDAERYLAEKGIA
ncbi:MAG: thioredoxin-disulfide reductase [Bacteroidetes bacterium]|nr:thioredoxin-disulfide reductase [Bacteroidota bacterium]